ARSSARSNGPSAPHRLRPLRGRGAEHERDRGHPRNSPGYRGLAPAPGENRFSRAGGGLREAVQGGVVREPRRLREESPSALERVLLHTASSYRRPAATRAKTLAALGLAGSAA